MINNQTYPSLRVWLSLCAVLSGLAALSSCNQGGRGEPTPLSRADGTTMQGSAMGVSKHPAFVTDAQGSAIASSPLDIEFRLSDVGESGPEPSIGVTSSGCMFYTALEKVMRSCDQGQSWESVENVFSQPTTSDPYLWVDPITDRIYNVQMVSLVTTWIAWSDDDGETWLGNPFDNGPIPVNDHIKLATGPWTQSGYGQLGNMVPIHDTATYFCFNKLVGVFCYTSLDGGATFPLGAEVVGMAASGGLHGAITTAPDGTVYVPPRTLIPTVAYSKDNGLTWQETQMGDDTLTPSPRKNSEVGTDSASNAYHVWVGEDMGVYMSRSTDSGVSWDQNSIRVSPKAVVSSTFPHIDAGDPGRIAVAYLGSEDAEFLRGPDIDEVPWRGNPHTAPNDVVYHLYVTFSLNALDDNPIFHTYRITDDPVQRGSICISSADCRQIGGSNRNLLDFNDLHIDGKGRVYIAYADGCTGPCSQDGDATSSRDARGYAAILERGPSLFADQEPFGGLSK